MKFASATLLLSALAAASPIYQIEWVTLTQYTTVLAGYDAYTSAFPQTSTSSSTQAPNTPEPVTTQTASSSSIQKTTQAVSEIPVPATTATTPTTTTTTPSAPTTSSTTSSSAGTGAVFSGDGTYYDTGLGACGWTNVDTDYIVAIGHGLFDQYTPNGNPNHNTLCGKKIIATHEGKSVEVTAVDRCEGCKPYDLDFSPAAFDSIADHSLGRVKITWQWA